MFKSWTSWWLKILRNIANFNRQREFTQLFCNSGNHIIVIFLLYVLIDVLILLCVYK